MKVGSLVKTKDGRLGIVKSYHLSTGGIGTSYPWYVYMMDNNWTVEYFQTKQLEVINV